jgi:hypothetical protein
VRRTSLRCAAVPQAPITSGDVTSFDRYRKSDDPVVDTAPTAAAIAAFLAEQVVGPIPFLSIFYYKAKGYSLPCNPRNEGSHTCR